MLGALSPAIAEQTPFCGLSREELQELDLETSLTGKWQIHGHEGTIEENGQVLQLPKDEPVNVEINLKNDGLWLIVTDPPAMALKASWVEDQTWNFIPTEGTLPEATNFLTDEALVTAIGCDKIDILPRLEVSKTVLDYGRPIDMSFFLYVVDVDMIHGVAIAYMNDGNFISRRRISLERF